MRFMIIVRATKHSEAGIMPKPEDGLMEAMAAYHEDLARAGVLLDANGLQPTGKGFRVRCAGDRRSMVDGPFAETKKLIAGDTLIQTKSREEAVEWARRMPSPYGRGVDGEIEVRQLHELDDFEPARRSRGSGGWSSRARAREPATGQDREEHVMQVQSYLFFEGRCEEALEFYKQALGAEVLMMMRNEESPEPPRPGMMPPGAERKIMHASFRVGDSIVMGSDGFSSGKPSFGGFALSLTVKDQAEAERRFSALSEGGHVKMPLSKTFFSPAFGMLADKFGVPWMVMVQA